MVGNRLRRARELAGLSLGQAAKLLGWHPWCLAEIESGQVPIVNWRLYSDLYGCSLDWLRGADPVVPEATRKMLRDADLNPAEREDLMELIGSMGRRSEP